MFDFDTTPKFYINLDRRPDRRVDMEAKFNQLSMKVERWPAVDWRTVTVPKDSAKNYEANAKGIYACALSHIGLIKHAKENNFKYIVIFEDDITFSPNFLEEVRCEEMRSASWDMFMLGGHGGVRYRRGNYFMVEHCAGTYGYILHEGLYDFILYDWNYHFGIDQFYGDLVQPHNNVLAKIPWLVNTFPNYSDVAGHYVDYKLDE